MEEEHVNHLELVEQPLLQGEEARQEPPLVTEHDQATSVPAERGLSQELECRICGDTGPSLITPCACAGSVSAVHSECLQAWIESRPQQDEERRLQCEICHGQYQVTFENTFICDCEHSCSQAARHHLCDFAVMLLTAAGLAWVCFTIRPAVERDAAKNGKSGDDIEGQIRTIYIGTGLVLFFSLLTMRVICRRFRAASSRHTLLPT